MFRLKILKTRFQKYRLSRVILLWMLFLSIFGFAQNTYSKDNKVRSYNTILEELKSSPYWFVDHAELRKSKKDEYYKFNDTSLGLDLFEYYVLWKIENCYWYDFSNASYSIRKNTKTELIIIHNTGGDDFRELRFRKEDGHIIHSLGEYLNGELVMPVYPELKMIKLETKPLNVCGQ